MRKILLTFCTILFLCGTASAQYDMRAPLPLDARIRVGKLPNRMTYYIYHNEEPKDRVEIHIIQNVGALLENDNQNGLAHFLEHMAFNGTKNFPDKAIIKTLENHGVSFGANINAYTAHGETVYNLSNIPVNDLALLDTCLLVLHDWSHYITLDHSEIDDERGVITEEWRTRRNMTIRLMDQYNPVLYEGSQYAVRDVIGDVNVIRTFDYQTLADFYHDWYRTDLQAIAVVGDIDVDHMEARIKALFSSIPAVENPMPRPSFAIPDRTDVGYVCATDKELTASSVNVYMIRPVGDQTDHQSVKDQYMRDMYGYLMHSRIKEIVDRGDPNLNAGSASSSQMTAPDYKSFCIFASSRADCDAEAFGCVYREVERARRHGFTEGELDRIRKNMLSNLEIRAQKADKKTNRILMAEIKNLYLRGIPVVDEGYYCAFAKHAVESITLDDMATLARELPDKKNMVIIVQGPENVSHATRDDILAAMERIEKSELMPYVDEGYGRKMLDKELAGGKIIKTKKLQSFDAEEWTLDNGAHVIFAHSDRNKGEVELTAVSYGGESALEADLLPAAAFLGQLMPSFGLADCDMVAWRKCDLADKMATSHVELDDYMERVKGLALNAEAFEPMLQYVYLRFEKPRFDRQIFDVLMDRNARKVAAAQDNPTRAANDSINLLMSGHSPRTILMTEEVVRGIRFEDIEKIYRDRFCDASDFTFFIVGDVSPEVAKPLVEKYIGSISSTHRKDPWRDHKMTPPAGRTVKKLIVPYETPKATVCLFTMKDIKYTPHNLLSLKVLEGILRIRYTANIREKEGGTYGVAVVASNSVRPREKASVSMQFDCNPERADYLKTLLYGEIEDIKRQGVTTTEVENVVKNLLKERAQVKTSGDFTMNTLIALYDTKIDTSDPENYEEILRRITPSDIRNLAVDLFGPDSDVVDLIICSPDTE